MTTNQAFIKAYRHDGAQQLPAGHVAETATTRALARPVTARANRSASVDALSATVSYVSPAAAALEFDSRPVALQSAALAERTVSPYAPDNLEVAEPILASPYAPTVDALRGPAPKRPLSTYLRQGGANARPASMSLRPGTTLASIQWPTACRNLLSRHGEVFERVTDSLLAQVDAGKSIVGVLGLFRGVGCTTTTLCLAAQAAESGKRVVIVDGHFQSPQLASCLDAEPTAWWQDVLERGAALGDALVRGEEDRLDLLPLNPYSRSTPPALQLSATAGALRHTYDLALVDLGTFFDPTSQPIALEMIRHMRIDAALVVAGPASHDPRDLDTVTERLGECGCQMLGTIDNRVSV